MTIWVKQRNEGYKKKRKREKRSNKRERSKKQEKPEEEMKNGKKKSKLNEKGRTMDALALDTEEGRDKLRKATCSCK